LFQIFEVITEGNDTGNCVNLRRHDFSQIIPQVASQKEYKLIDNCTMDTADQMSISEASEYDEPNFEFSDDEIELEDSENESFESEEEDNDDTQIDGIQFNQLEKDQFESPLKFRTHTTAKLLKQMSAQSKHLEDLLQISKQQAIALLHYFSWNTEVLIDQYTSDPEKIIEAVGISVESDATGGSQRKEYTDDSFECMICCDIEHTSYQLKCGHEYGVNCYQQYISEKLDEGRLIKCPSCDLSLTSQDIDNISGEGKGDELLKSSIKEFVQRKPRYKWCPSPDCDMIIEILNGSDIPSLVKDHKVPVATCTYGHQFCVYCGYENHVPAPCILAKKWVAKCQDDSETANWILANTKQCPACGSSIEKNGGCNHMSCKKCKHEFCWICLGEWKKHGGSFYECGRYKPNDGEKKNKNNVTKQDEARRSLKRYIHFYNLFNIHEISIKQDTARCLVVEETVREMQETSGISWIEAQFLVDSANTLLAARRVLEWSNAVAFYCDSNSFFSLFENVQASLSSAVEALSKLFEIEDPSEIVQSKLQFLNRQRFLSDRQYAMIGCVEDAISNKTLDLDDLGS
jgi:ariadne-1